MTQKSKEQRARRRRQWFDRELPMLLVRLRLVAPPEVVRAWVNTPMRQRPTLWSVVHHFEAKSLNRQQRS